MRILHIESLDPVAGSPAMVIARLAAAQAALGHMVTICSSRDTAELPAITDRVFNFQLASRRQRGKVKTPARGENPSRCNR